MGRDVAGPARHLDRSRLSFLGGRKLYLVGKPDAVSAITTSIEALVLDVDKMIDVWRMTN